MSSNAFRTDEEPPVYAQQAMHVVHEPDRLTEAGSRAKAAEAQGDDVLASAEWRRYRLIRDARRDPDELLAEGIALSAQAAQLAAASR